MALPTRFLMQPILAALLVLASLALAGAGSAVVSPSELEADPDRFDEQVVTLQGTVDKFRERIAPDGSLFGTFRVSDGQATIRVFSRGRSLCQNGMQATVEGTFEKVDRLGSRARHHVVLARFTFGTAAP